MSTRLRTPAEFLLDEEVEPIGLPAYRQLELREALGRRQDYERACQELSAVVQHLYVRGAKRLQACVCEDVRAAIQCCSGWHYDSRALRELLRAVEQHMPKAKREALLREHKQAQLLLRRQQKRDEKQEAEARFRDLPGHLLPKVFCTLDPLSLLRASAVNREWQAAATQEALWERFQHLSLAEGRGSEEQRRVRAMTLAWRSNRRLQRGRLVWKPQDQAALSEAGSTPLSVPEVLRILQGCADWADSSDSDSDEELLSAPMGARRFWQLGGYSQARAWK